MRRQQRTKIDNLIEPALLKVAKRASPYFGKSAIINEVTNNKALAAILADLRDRYGAWKIDQLILRYIDSHVGHALQQRDANGIRVYECYGAGESERRWQPLRALTADKLRLVMRQTRREAAQLERKGEGYHIILEELERLRRPDATVDDVYERALPKIKKFREKAA